MFAETYLHTAGAQSKNMILQRKIRQLLKFLTIMFCGSFVLRLIISWFREDIDIHFHYSRYHKHCNAKKTIPSVDKQDLKRLLFYTTYFEMNIWPHYVMWPSWNFTRKDGKPCAHNCIITYNKCDLPYSDAVIFHEADMFRAHILKFISIYRNPQQRWIYFTNENPHNARHDPSQYNGIFNWTITYRRDSDVIFPYGLYGEIQSPMEIVKSHTTTNYAQGKDKLIVWAASHCGLIRDKVVHKMLQFLPVTVIGGCSKLFNQTSPSFCGRESKNCSSFLRTFKFYLAFENGMCTDYITEKYWNTPFDHDMVPIVLGANYDANVAIPGSYINILDFQSIKDLAEFIKYLDRNDTVYNEYFQWKTKFTRIEPGEKYWTCQLCANLYNDSLPKKVYTNLGAYWGDDNNCDKSLQSKLERTING